MASDSSYLIPLLVFYLSYPWFIGHISEHATKFNITCITNPLDFYKSIVKPLVSKSLLHEYTLL